MCEKNKAVELIWNKLFAKSDKQRIFDCHSKKLAAETLHCARKYGIKRSSSLPDLKQVDFCISEFAHDDLKISRYVHAARSIVSVRDFYTGPTV